MLYIPGLLLNVSTGLIHVSAKKYYLQNPVGPKTSMSETIKAREKGPITHTLTNNFQSLCPKSTFVLKAMDKKASEKDDSHIQAFIKMVVYTLHSPGGRT